jgi:hypothetical protein
MTNIFEQASRIKLRFPSTRGDLMAEHLWDLPLSSKSGADLDTVAKSVNAALKECTEESFVATSTSPAQALHTLRLEIVKHIIAVRLDENKAKLEAADKAAKKARLLDALARKQDASLEAMSEDEIRAQLKDL